MQVPARSYGVPILPMCSFRDVTVEWSDFPLGEKLELMIVHLAVFAVSA